MSEAQISPGLAFALAGQVSAGLTPGDLQPERMQASLIAIGLMVMNACDDQLVRDALALSERSRVSATGDGSYRVTYTPQEGHDE